MLLHRGLWRRMFSRLDLLRLDAGGVGWVVGREGGVMVVSFSSRRSPKEICTALFVCIRRGPVLDTHTAPALLSLS